MENTNTGSHYAAPSRLDSASAGVILILLYMLVVLVPMGLVLLLKPRTDEYVLTEAGMLCALTAFQILVLQVVLAGRFKALQRPYGLDMVMKFHRNMGGFALILLVAHPLLLAAGSGHWMLLGLQTGWQVNLGKAALVLLVLGVLTALIFPWLKIDYNTWRFWHKGMVVVLILGFVHSFLIGDDLEFPILRGWWILIFLAAAGLFCYRNFIVPFKGKRHFQIQSVKRETHNTWTLKMVPVNAGWFSYRPGQFQFLTLKRPGRMSEEHPFTLSSSPENTNEITATIKESGNFTNTIGETKQGDQAWIEAPYGRFSFVFHQPAQLLMIAGGVGITPLMSMLRYLRDTGDTRPVVLIYANNTQEDIIFKDELDALPENMKVVHVLKDPPPNRQGPKGYVTREIIEQSAKDILRGADVYLCGPPVMMKKVKQILVDLGIPGRRIHFERFTLP